MKNNTALNLSAANGLAYTVRENTPALDDVLTAGFRDYALQTVGMDEHSKDITAFLAHDGETMVGAVVVGLFWKQLHIRKVFVYEPYRGRGIATQLMEQAHDFGRQRGCTFAFLETLSFMAEDFYKKIGYVREFARGGYVNDLEFIHMKKMLGNDDNA